MAVEFLSAESSLTPQAHLVRVPQESVVAPVQGEDVDRDLYFTKRQRCVLSHGEAVLYETEVPNPAVGRAASGEYTSRIFIADAHGSTALLSYDGDGIPVYGVFDIADTDVLQRHYDSRLPLMRDASGNYPTFRRTIDTTDFTFTGDRAIARGKVENSDGKETTITVIIPSSAVGFATELRNDLSNGTKQNSESDADYQSEIQNSTHIKRGDLSQDHPVHFRVSSRQSSF